MCHVHVLSCCVIQCLAVSGLLTILMRSSPIPSRLRHRAFIFLEFSFTKKVLPVITSHLEPFLSFQPTNMSIREASHSGSWYPSSGMKNFRKLLSIWDYIKRETMTMNLKAFVVLFFCPWKSSQGAEREVRRMVIQSQSLVTTSQGDYSTVSICNVSEIRLPIEVLLNRWAIV